MVQIRIEKRLVPRWWIRMVVFFGSIVAALFLGGLLMVLQGISPLVAYNKMLDAFITPYGLSETLVKAIPLMIMGLGVGIAFRMLLWNIGAEGQYCMGAVAACGAALSLPHLPSLFIIPLMLTAGFLAGALWGAIPAALKAYFRTNEIITTLMMNYIAIYFTEYLIYGPWKDPAGYQFPMTAVIPQAAFLPQFGMTRIHWGILVAVLLITIFYVVLNKTRWGYEIRVIGENPEAARYSGIDIKKNIILVLMVSGGLAGLAGMCELAGIQHRLQHGFNLGYGYTAIIIAWLAKLQPRAIIFVSFLFAGLMVSGDLLQMTIPGAGTGLSAVLQGIILFVVLAGEFLNEYTVVIKKGAGDRGGNTEVTKGAIKVTEDTAGR